MASKVEKAQMRVARIAANLFIRQGVAATSGSDIADAAGISERTLWRYFRTKEASVAPLFAATWQQYVKDFKSWPRNQSIEEHLAVRFDLKNMTEEDKSDGLLVVLLIAAMPNEPDLRSVWLMSYQGGEEDMCAIIGDRTGRSHQDFDVRLCAAAAVSAIRTIDETISVAAIRDGQEFTLSEVVSQVSRALRAVSSLPYCDPVVASPFGTES